jgi:ABC-type phosphate/phosphonate transport system substrate-binding protein
MREVFVLGAVAYDPKVVTIWDGFVQWFATRGFAFDYVLFTNYERLVEAQFAGVVHCAWNSPLAWIETERLAARLGRAARALAMRDTDQDLTSTVLVRREADLRTLSDLRGRRVGVGAHDSPQATLLPLAHIAAQGIDVRSDLEVVVHDVLAGKHGDHVGGERDAVKALLAGTVDAACVLDANVGMFVREGTAREGALRVLAQTAPYDHCNFTVLDDAPEELVARFASLLLAQRYDDPDVRLLMDLEGLKAWRNGRTSGYTALAAACDRFGTLDAWLSRATKRFEKEP